MTERQPEPPSPRPSPIPTGRYSWFVGVVFILVAGFALYQTIINRESGTLGLGAEDHDRIVGIEHGSSVEALRASVGLDPDTLTARILCHRALKSRKVTEPA